MNNRPSSPPAAPGGPTDLLGANPYVGPRAFTEGDRDRFFGRDQESRQLASLIIAERVVLFYAQSGAGKTSLLQASVVPQLRERKDVVVLPISRVGGDLPPGVAVDSVANIYVFNALLNLLGQALQPGELGQLSLTQGLAQLVSPPTDEENPQTYLLILDQFEELFTTHPDRASERSAFMHQLQQALNSYPQLGLLLAMREDFIAHLDPHTSQMPDRLRVRYRIEPLTYAAALPAVQTPAAQAGRPFAEGVAEALVDNLRRIQRSTSTLSPNGAEATNLAAAAGEDGAGIALGAYVEPVQLQIVCRQLWASLPPGGSQILARDVEEFGDVDRALIDFYEGALQTALAQTTLSERYLRSWFRSRLITPARTRGLVYRGAEETDGLPNPAVDSLNNAYVIRADIRGGDTWYELAHDRLVEPILEANQAWQAGYDNPVERAYQAWREAGQDPQKLLRGNPLSEAEAHARAHPNDMTAEEQQFLEESRRQAALEEEAARQLARRRRVYAITAIVVIAILAALSLVAWNNANEATANAELAVKREAEAKIAQGEAVIAASTAVASEAVAQRAEAERRASIAATREAEAQIERVKAERQARFAQASQLAANARAVDDPSGSLPLILAREAVLTTWLTDTRVITQPIVTAAAETALRAAIHQAEALPWQMTLPQDHRLRHTSDVRAVAYSPDGATLASAGDDRTVRLWDAQSGDALQVLIGHTADVNTVAFSPDGQSIASGGQGETVRLWDRSTGNLRRVLRGHLGWVTSVAYSPDSKILASASEDKTIRLWDISTASTLSEVEGLNTGNATGEAVRVLSGHEGSITSVAISPDGQTLASSSADQTIRLWDISTGQTIQTLLGHDGPVNAVTFSPDGQTLASGGDDMTVLLWDVASGEEITWLEGHDDAITALAFSPDGATLASASRDWSVELWDVASGEEITWLPGHFEDVLAVTFSPDGQTLATGGRDNTVRLWAAQASSDNDPALLVPSGHTGPVTAVAFNPVDNNLASAGADMTVRLWDISTESTLSETEGLTTSISTESTLSEAEGLNPSAATVQEIDVLAGHEDTVLAVAFSPDGQMLASAGAEYDPTVRLWDIATSEEVHILEGHNIDSAIKAVAFSPDGTILASAGTDQTVRLWDPATGEEVVTLTGHEDAVNAVAFSPDGRMLASSGGEYDPTVRLWDPATGQAVGTLAGHEDTVNAVAFSLDGGILASAGGEDDPTVRLWDPATGETVGTLTGHEDAVNGVAFSPDGETLASAGADQTVRLWDVTSGQQVTTLAGHIDVVNAVAFSADGQTIVSVGDDQTMRFWLVDPLANQNVLRGHTNWVRTAVFSPDGQIIASASNDGTVRLWDARTGRRCAPWPATPTR